MSRRAKITFVFSIGTVLNLFGYLYLTGSWKIFFTSSVHKAYRDDTLHDRNIERELSELLHKSVDDHRLSQHNITKLVDNFLRDKFPITVASDKNVPSVEKLKKYVVEVKNVSEHREEIPAKDDERPGPQEKGGELEGGEETLPLVQKAEAKPKLGKILSAVDAFINGKVEKPVNPHDFNYMINEPGKCKNPDGSDTDVFLLVLICSVHKNFESRNAIRQSWGSPVEVDGHKVITMFLLAKRSDVRLQNLVLEENEQYHDIIMEDFDDTYKNLTLKTMMGMKWMSTFCAQAKYMVKTDDDVYVSYKNIVTYLGKSPDSKFVTGMVINGSPIRNPNSKWYMPKNLYPGSRYPPFCSGTGYILSGDVPPLIYQTSLSTPYLYLEDVFVAICIDKLKIIPKNHREFHNWRTTYTFCHFKRILTAHMVTPTEMLRYWNDQNTNAHKC